LIKYIQAIILLPVPIWRRVAANRKISIESTLLREILKEPWMVVIANEECLIIISWKKNHNSHLSQGQEQGRLNQMKEELESQGQRKIEPIVKA